ncbi:MAG: hypothetical protein IPK23_14915 [Rhizobiales bacterium]|nr:hypothetical protein [Hyphomicrobiales bacterium]
MSEHPITQAIDYITVWNGTEAMVEVGAYPAESYRVGYDGVTRSKPARSPACT